MTRPQGRMPKSVYSFNPVSLPLDPKNQYACIHDNSHLGIRYEELVDCRFRNETLCSNVFFLRLRGLLAEAGLEFLRKSPAVEVEQFLKQGKEIWFRSLQQSFRLQMMFVDPWGLRHISRGRARTFA